MVALAGGGAIGSAIWYAAKLDSRMQQVESRLDKGPATVPFSESP